ncbi:hypothetical protein EDB89DRAFT_1911017 [Lactarius sanguifluus]|nr:hypothetical protein EDB89DRAFT_1911017 [Lactarius sanguifluus]
MPVSGSAAMLGADSALGLFRGLTLFAQLWYTVGAMARYDAGTTSVSDVNCTLDPLSWVHASPNISLLCAYSAFAVITSVVTYVVALAPQEIHIPGHTFSIFTAHNPNTSHVPRRHRAPHTRIEPTAGQLRLMFLATVNFTGGLLSAVAKLFQSTLFSTGSDEINVRCYQDDAQTQQEMPTDSALDTRPPIPSNWCIVCLHRAFPSKTDPRGHEWDCWAGGWVSNNSGGNSWRQPFKTWQNAYSFDSLANLTAAQAPLASTSSNSSGQNSPARRTSTQPSGPVLPRPPRSYERPWRSCVCATARMVHAAPVRV